MASGQDEVMCSELPPELIEQILLYTTDLADLWECAVVCRTWNDLFRGQYDSYWLVQSIIYWTRIFKFLVVLVDELL